MIGVFRPSLKGRVRTQGGINALQYSEAVLEDLIVPEAQESVALFS